MTRDDELKGILDSLDMKLGDILNTSITYSQRINLEKAFENAKSSILAWHNRQLEQAVRETEWRERIKSVKYVQEILECPGKLTCSRHKTHEIPELIKVLELKQQEQSKTSKAA